MRMVNPDATELAKVPKALIKKWTDEIAALQTIATAANDALDSARRGRAGTADQVLASFQADLDAANHELNDLTLGQPGRVDHARALADAAASQLAASRARLADLRDALRRVSAVWLGTVTTELPLLLLPVRLETRFEYAGNAAVPQALRVRVYPDDIHVDAHEPALTADELGWGAAYWSRRGAAGSANDRAAWRQLATRFGARRAAWIALAADPAAASRPETRPTSWTRAAQARLVPGRWLALAFRNGHIVAAAVSAAVTPGLAVSPSPSAGVPSVSPADGLPAVDAALRWMIDYDAALAAGMALRLPLDGDGAATPGAAAMDRLVVVGVAGDLDGAAGAAQLAALLAAHRFTGGLRLLPADTPTNNTVDAPAGAAGDPAADDAEAVYALERGAPQIDATVPAGVQDRRDGHWLAWTLGLPPGTFARAAHAAGTDIAQGLAALGALLPQADSPLLRRIGAGRANPAAGQPWAAPAGVVPALQLGDQPYAILPVTGAARPGDEVAASGDWQPAAPALRTELWQAGAAARGFRGGADIVALMRQTGSGSGYLALPGPDQPAAAVQRPAVLGRVGWPAGLAEARQRDALDAVARRPDVWVGAAAAQRLAALRDARPAGLRIGAWGCVEGLRPAARPVAAPASGSGPAAFTTPGNLGYVQTPSLTHAATAAVLRSGYRSGVAAAAVDLSSARVRRAKQLLDAVRQGQPLGAILGYRFERALREGGLGHYVPLFRKLAGIGGDDTIATAEARVAAADAALTALQRRWEVYKAAAAGVATLQTAYDDASTVRTGWQTLLDAALAEGRAAGQAQQAAQAALGTAVAKASVHAGLRPVGKTGDYDPGQKPPLRIEVPETGEFERWSAEQAALEGDVATEREKLAQANQRLAASALAAIAPQFNLSEDGEPTKAWRKAATNLRDAQKALGPAPPATDTADAALGEARQALRDAVVASWKQAASTSLVYRGVDGLALHRRWQKATANPQAPVWTIDTIPFGEAALGFPAAGSAEFTAVQGVLAALADDVDAVGDLTLAEATFQLVSGNPARAAAALDVIAANGAPPPAEYEVIRTPRSGLALTHRVVSLLPAAAAGGAWAGGKDGVRAIAEPALEACAAALLPPPQAIVCDWQAVDAQGRQMAGGRADATLLGMAALDFVAAAAASVAGAAAPGATELGGRLAFLLGSRHPEWAEGTALRLTSPAPSGLAAGVVPLADAIELGDAVYALLASARPLDARDFGAAEAGADLAELAGRIAGIRGLAAALLADLRQATEATAPVAAALNALLLRATAWRVTGGTPVRSRPAADVVAQARAVAAELGTRLARERALAAAAVTLAGLYDRAHALLGADAQVLPVIGPGAAVAACLATMQPSAGLLGKGPVESIAPAWLRRMAYVREGAGRLQRVAGYLGALGLTAAAGLDIGQFPFTAGERWVGLAPLPDQPLATGRVSVVAHHPLGSAPAPCKGLLHDEWVEFVPCGQRQGVWDRSDGPVASDITGVAFHFDAPVAAAPNLALLAVTGDGPAWHLDLLQRTVGDALDLAVARSAPADGRAELLWFSDTLPPGATEHGDDPGGGWQWTTDAPPPPAGRLVHRDLAGPGFHQHYFLDVVADARLRVGSGDSLTVHVCVEAGTPPAALIVQWVCLSPSGALDWEHRAVWCNAVVLADDDLWDARFSWGTPGTASRFHAGDPPPPGSWVRLEVPARAIDLEGRAPCGLAFGVIDGGAIWGAAGRLAGAGGAWSGLRNDETWFGDRPPAGAALASDYPGRAWQWTTDRPAPFGTGEAVRSCHVTPSQPGMHQHYFTGATETLTLAAGDVLFAYVNVTPTDMPTALMLQWVVGGDWEHRALWGPQERPAAFVWGTLGEASLRWIGGRPPPENWGRWVRLEVPVEAVGLAGKDVSGMAFVLFEGSAAWGPAGVSRPARSNILEL